jgi:hypothetical protein
MATDYRAELVKLMKATLADQAANHDWTYAMVRPMPVPHTWAKGQKVRGDCSKGVQYLNRWAGCQDPMGMNYGVYGNSYTLWVHLQDLDSVAELLAGDVITFGFDGDEHATMVLEPGADPLLWSFGHQGAPDTYRLSFDRRPHQLLRNPLPHYVPTPQDKLRAKTGWFSWMAWALGEGDWKPYGKGNKAVRPNVPRLIPLSWWRRRAKFLLKRKRGNPPTT